MLRLVGKCLVALIILVLIAAPVLAQGRTTPVEVKNQIGINSANNTVKAEQLGMWTVNIGGTPTFGINPAQNTVKAEQSGGWTVGITGTVNANVTNNPFVKIDSTTNTVKAPTQTSKIQLWSTNQVVPAGSSLDSAYIDCTGYKQLNVVVSANSNSTQLQLHVYFRAGDNSMYGLGFGNFATPANPITNNGNYLAYDSRCYLSLPVLSNQAMVSVKNITGAAVTVHNTGWVYLTN